MSHPGYIHPSRIPSIVKPAIVKPIFEPRTCEGCPSARGCCVLCAAVVRGVVVVGGVMEGWCELAREITERGPGILKTFQLEGIGLKALGEKLDR